jgi:cytochrome c oxidase cbb3-type subunit I
VQAVAAGWYAQSLWTLWLAPLALTGAYYIVPKGSGRALPSYDFAPLGFWTLVFIGGWTGGRHLIGGPVPAWIPTIAVVACCMLLFHYLVLFLNLRVAIGSGGTALGFIKFGLFAYLLGGVLDAITSFRGVAVETQFTFIATAMEQLALYGGISMMLFGGLYYMLPRLTGRPWASGGLVLGHRVLVTAGIVVLVVTLFVAGLTQGNELLNPKMGMADIFGGLRLTLMLSSGAQLALLVANLLLFVNFAGARARVSRARRRFRILSAPRRRWRRTSDEKRHVLLSRPVSRPRDFLGRDRARIACAVRRAGAVLRRG